MNSKPHEYLPASRVPVRLVGLPGEAEVCLAGDLPFFLACGASLVLWLVVAAVAVFGGMADFLALGLGLGGGGGRGGGRGETDTADVSRPLGRGLSTNKKVNTSN